MDVFVAGYDRTVWHREQLSTGPGAQWSDWAGLGGVILEDILPVADSWSELNLFVLGQDRSVCQLKQSEPGDWQ